ncbi:MAG: DsbA family protein [Terriglobia bacterium]
MRLKPVPVLLLLLLVALAQTAATQTQSPTQKERQAATVERIEAYLRYLFALGPEAGVEVATPLPSVIPGLLTTQVRVRRWDATLTEALLVSADGRYVIRSRILDTSQDPFAATRGAITTSGHPSKGPADAPVTIVEYGDFQCPTCARMHPVLQQVLADHNDVRLVFKDLPLTQVHDWAMAAAIAGQCALQESDAAFWSLHDYFFQNQSQLTAQNLQSRLDQFASNAGMSVDPFRACRQQESTRARVQASLREAAQLQATGTPTFFINGRRLTGDQTRETLERIISFELRFGQQGSSPP